MFIFFIVCIVKQCQFKLVMHSFLFAALSVNKVKCDNKVIYRLLSLL